MTLCSIQFLRPNYFAWTIAKWSFVKQYGVHDIQSSSKLHFIVTFGYVNKILDSSFTGWYNYTKSSCKTVVNRSRSNVACSTKCFTKTNNNNNNGDDDDNNNNNNNNDGNNNSSSSNNNNHSKWRTLHFLLALWPWRRPITLKLHETVQCSCDFNHHFCLWKERERDWLHTSKCYMAQNTPPPPPPPHPLSYTALFPFDKLTNWQILFHEGVE